MVEKNELLPAKYTEMTPKELFVPDMVDNILKAIKEKAESFEQDMTTKKGRTAIASIASKVARSKTFLDGIGKELVADKKKEVKKVDEQRKRIREFCDDLKAEIRKPLTDFEEAEKAKEEAWAEFLADLERGVEFDATADKIQARIDELNAMEYPNDISDDDYDKAASIKLNTIHRLMELLESQLQIEKERAELAELKQKEAERKEQEVAEKRAQELAQAEIDKAKKDQEIAERMAEEAKAEAKRQKEQREAAEKKAAEEKAEQKRKEQERLELEKKEAEIRAENKAKNREAIVVAFFNLGYGLTTQEAKLIVADIEQGKVPGVSIEYDI
jgi:hypothetical protein